LRILQVGKYYPPVRGGIENNVHFLARGLAARHQVTALVFHTARGTVRETREGVEVVRAGTFGRVLSTEIAPAYIPLLLRTPADVVHLHTPNPLGELGCFLSRGRAALVVTHHSDVIRQRGLRFLYGPVLDAVYRRADRIIVYTRRYMETSATLAPFAGKCAVIPHGLDLREFEAGPEVESRAAEIRRLHGGKIVLFVGRLVYYKGVDVLLKALAGLDARVLVAGDGPMRAPLESLARELGVAERTVFLGEVPHAEKVALYRACAVFALPCTHRSEAFGQVQVEAQACRRPVVSTEVDSGVPYVNRHGVTGLVVPPSDPAALREAMAKLLADPGLRARMGEAGRARAEAEFSVETMLRDTFALYDEVARERGIAPARAVRQAAQRP
jgi:rhamnosyl/mannosyltransferase